MKTINVSEATNLQLDWLVAKAEGLAVSDRATKWRSENCPHKYSEDPRLAYPIIEREGIEIKKGNPLYFPKGNENGEYYEPLWIAQGQHGQTPFMAAMRAYCVSFFGQTAEVPEEL